MAAPDLISVDTVLTHERTELETRAAALTIASQADYERAGAFLRDVKALLRKVHDGYDEIVDRAHKTWKTAIAKRAEHLEPVERAERVVKGRMAAYAQAEERRAREEQARLEREARAAEARRLAEERAAEEAARLAEAEALESAGMHDEASAVLDAPMPEPEPLPPPPPPVRAAPKAEGVAVREVWTAEVVDLAALVRAVAAGQAPATLLKVDTAALGGFARATKGSVKVAGVLFRAEKSVAARAS